MPRQAVFSRKEAQERRRLSNLQSQRKRRKKQKQKEQDMKAHLTTIRQENRSLQARATDLERKHVDLERRIALIKDALLMASTNLPTQQQQQPQRQQQASAHQAQTQAQAQGLFEAQHQEQDQQHGQRACTSLGTQAAEAAEAAAVVDAALSTMAVPPSSPMTAHSSHQQQQTMQEAEEGEEGQQQEEQEQGEVAELGLQSLSRLPSISTLLEHDGPLPPPPPACAPKASGATQPGATAWRPSSASAASSSPSPAPSSPSSLLSSLTAAAAAATSTTSTTRAGQSPPSAAAGSSASAMPGLQPASLPALTTILLLLTTWATLGPFGTTPALAFPQGAAPPMPQTTAMTTPMAGGVPSWMRETMPSSILSQLLQGQDPSQMGWAATHGGPAAHTAPATTDKMGATPAAATTAAPAVPTTTAARASRDSLQTPLTTTSTSTSTLSSSGARTRSAMGESRQRPPGTYRSETRHSETSRECTAQGAMPPPPPSVSQCTRNGDGELTRGGGQGASWMQALMAGALQAITPQVLAHVQREQTAQQAPPSSQPSAAHQPHPTPAVF